MRTESGSSIPGRDGMTVLRGQTWQGTVGGWDARGHGFGAWTLDVTHFYDFAARTL